MKVSSHDNGRGRRILVELGNEEHQWTVEFATVLRDALTRAIGEPHPQTPALTDREAMVWAAAYVAAEMTGRTAADASIACLASMCGEWVAKTIEDAAHAAKAAEAVIEADGIGGPGWPEVACEVLVVLLGGAR